ncbi:sigma-70 family RNA polymerase sigma factor [Nodosilinea sp. LEGE 07088]|uniref:RNA polymerase sigma factor n=1 Tax=Nodosilinea sp. LEGE 07088 TaxID=2777968 RepID=UPI001882C86E|nr:sigma-70 family RNA polymerase sigma factor [Nodosilinea sp. LEGE 07088]MBE9136847.1 sigma-70 family RNA polymerase sigma factor [Nodosilinea sp. LEGE 07088]
MPSQHPSETQQFNRDVQFLLKPNNPHARSLLAFIQRTIRQFGLQAHVTEIDIFVEAYLRGVKHTQQHQEEIRQPKAWMRRTAYNIIRECKRDRMHYSTLAFDELMDQGRPLVNASPPSGVEDEVIVKAIDSVLQAVNALSPSDRALIQWKVIEGCSWQEVQTRLIAQGEERVSHAALRKRGQRSLERLRRAYHIFNNAPGSLKLADDLSDHPDGDTVAPPVSASSPSNTYNTEDTLLWSITLEGNFTETVTDNQLKMAILAELRQKSKDPFLRLISVRQGSIIIELGGSAEGYQIIQALISSGQLTNILGLPVRHVGLVGESPDDYQPPLNPQECSESSPQRQRPEIPQRRSDMYTFLLNLPAPQFNAVVFDLNPPRGNLAQLDASPGERVAALLDWLESSVGPGIDALRISINSVLNRL